MHISVAIQSRSKCKIKGRFGWEFRSKLKGKSKYPNPNTKGIIKSKSKCSGK